MKEKATGDCVVIPQLFEGIVTNHFEDPCKKNSMQYWKVRRVFPGSPDINSRGWLFLTNNHDSVANVSFPG